MPRRERTRVEAAAGKQFVTTPPKTLLSAGAGEGCYSCSRLPPPCFLFTTAAGLVRLNFRIVRARKSDSPSRLFRPQATHRLNGMRLA